MRTRTEAQTCFAWIFAKPHAQERYAVFDPYWGRTCTRHAKKGRRIFLPYCQHFRGSKKIAVYPGTHTRHLLIDLDLHDLRHYEDFLIRLACLTEFLRLPMMARLKPHIEVDPGSGSVHIVLVMPLEWDEEWERARPGKWQLSKVQGFIAWLLEKLAYQYPDEDWSRLEIFGRNQHDYALPLSGTYKMFIDRPLDKVQGYYQDHRHQRTSCQTQDIVAYMNWLVDPEAKSCAWDAAIKEVRQIVRNRLDQEEVQQAPAKERKSVRPGAMARVQWQGRFLQNIIDFRTGNLPEDSLGCFATPIRRYLAVACDKDQDLIDDLFKLIFEEHQRKGLLTYSDRLANNPQEFWRSEGFLKKKIEAGNLYQQDPAKSTDKLQAVKSSLR